MKANGTYSTYQFRNATRELIDDHVKNHAAKPFFLYLPFQSGKSCLLYSTTCDGKITFSALPTHGSKSLRRFISKCERYKT